MKHPLQHYTYACPECGAACAICPKNGWPICEYCSPTRKDFRARELAYGNDQWDLRDFDSLEPTGFRRAHWITERAWE